MGRWTTPGQLPIDRSDEAILGFRAWRLTRSGRGPRLAPTTPRAVWEPGRAPAATCSGSHTRLYAELDPDGVPHRSPDKFCTCGYHAASDPAALVRPGGPAAVVGQVALWGRVIEHTKGWRAEYAYPSRLRLTCPWCIRIGDWPADPSVVLVHRDEELSPSCAVHQDRVKDPVDRLDADLVQGALLDAYGVRLLPEEILPSPQRIGTLTRAARIWDRRRVARRDR